MKNHFSSPEHSEQSSCDYLSQQTSADIYVHQHKLRLSYMPWLYKTLKPKHKEWAVAWQNEVQAHFQRMETIQFGKNCFIAPEAKLFAEPGRPIIIGDNCYIAADAVIHGPITMGNNVSVNHHVSMDGGRKGISIGDNSRIAAYCHLYAFNHGMSVDHLISAQPTHSTGIFIGQDVWLGANVGVVDGVTISDYAVVGMGSQVTKNVGAYAMVAGNPAIIIGDRRDKK